jgi:hypothetical protein
MADESAMTNPRCRSVFYNQEGRKIFIEFGRGYAINRKYTHYSKAEYATLFPNREYLSIAFIFYLDEPLDSSY